MYDNRLYIFFSNSAVYFNIAWPFLFASDKTVIASCRRHQLKRLCFLYDTLYVLGLLGMYYITFFFLIQLRHFDKTVVKQTSLNNVSPNDISQKDFCLSDRKELLFLWSLFIRTLYDAYYSSDYIAIFGEWQTFD